jgi:Protein of unknown function (DUF429)
MGQRQRGNSTVRLTRDLGEVFSLAAAGDALIVIDVPIGILSGRTAIAGRACDALARKDLGPIRRRASSPRPVERRSAVPITHKPLLAIDVTKPRQVHTLVVKKSAPAIRPSAPAGTSATMSGAPTRAICRAPSGSGQSLTVRRCARDF